MQDMLEKNFSSKVYISTYGGEGGCVNLPKAFKREAILLPLEAKIRHHRWKNVIEKSIKREFTLHILGENTHPPTHNIQIHSISPAHSHPPTPSGSDHAHAFKRGCACDQIVRGVLGSEVASANLSIMFFSLFQIFFAKLHQVYFWEGTQKLQFWLF